MTQDAETYSDQRAGSLPPIFWSRFLCALIVLGVVVNVIANALLGMREGKLGVINESMSFKHPSRTARYCDATAAALGDYLVEHGFSKTDNEPTFGGASHDGVRRVWYQLRDETPIWVFIGRSPARDLFDRASGKKSKLHIDEEMIVSVDWKTPGWRFNASRIESQAHALQEALDQWWQEYTAKHKDEHVQ